MARHRKLPEAHQTHFKVIAHYDKTLLPEYCQSIAQDKIARKLTKYCIVDPYCQIIGISEPPVMCNACGTAFVSNIKGELWYTAPVVKRLECAFKILFSWFDYFSRVNCSLTAS
jgi:hypothetical protein